MLYWQLVLQNQEVRLEAGETMNALEFLAQFKATDGKVDLGKNVVVIGGGNTLWILQELQSAMQE